MNPVLNEKELNEAREIIGSVKSLLETLTLATLGASGPLDPKSPLGRSLNRLVTADYLMQVGLSRLQHQETQAAPVGPGLPCGECVACRQNDKRTPQSPLAACLSPWQRTAP